MYFAQRLVGRSGDFFYVERLFAYFRFEGLRSDQQQLGALSLQRAGVLVTATERGNGRFDVAVVYLKVADVADGAAIEPRAQIGYNVTTGVTGRKQHHR